MKAFLSHSNNLEDQKYIDMLDVAFYLLGIPLYVAEYQENTEAGRYLIDKLNEKINENDVFLVLYTKHAEKSSMVSQEIGIANNSNKIIIAIVEKGVSPKGALEGKEHLPLNRDEMPPKAIKEIIERIKATLKIEGFVNTELPKLNMNEIDFLRFLIKQPDGKIGVEEIIRSLNLSNEDYNKISKKLDRNDLIYVTNDWDREQYCQLEDRGYEFLEAL